MTHDAIKEFRDKFLEELHSLFFTFDGKGVHVRYRTEDDVDIDDWMMEKLREAEERGYDEGERQHKLFLKKMTKEELDLYIEKLL